MVKNWFRIFGVAVGAVIALAAFLTGFANTGPGRHVAASLVEKISGGRVSIQGLSGRIPDRLRVAHLALSDETGPWLTADAVVLEWSPWTFLWNRVDISRLEAEKVRILRLPAQEQSDSNPTLNIAAVRLPHIETSAAVSRRPALLAAAGSVRYVSLQDWSADISLGRQDEPGTYRAQASFADGIIAGTATISEPSGGLVSALLGLSDIGPIAAEGNASRRERTNEVSFHLQAGALSAAGQGSFNIQDRTADIDFMARAPAMQLRPDLSWQKISAEGHLHGPFDRPDVYADVDIRGIDAQGAKLEAFAASVQGPGGAVRFTATATGLHLPYGEPDLFARAPIRLEGNLDIVTATRPLRFTLSHPLLTAEADGELAPRINGRIALKTSDLRPFAMLAGTDIGGRAALNLNVAFAQTSYRVVADGTIEAIGDSVVSKLTGPRARFSATTVVADSNISVESARFDGTNANGTLSGRVNRGVLDLSSTIALSDLSQLSQKLSGNLDIKVQASGPIARAKFAATGTADIATEGFEKQRLTFTANAAGFPRPASGDFRLLGRFDDAPMSVNGNFRTEGAMATHVILDRAAWKSVLAQADLTLFGVAPATGNAALTVTDLQDLAVFTGAPLQGSLQAGVTFTTRDNADYATLTAVGRNVAFKEYKVEAVNISGGVAKPFEPGPVSLDMAITGLNAAGLSGGASAQISGPLNKLAIRLTSALSDAEGRPIQIAAEGQFNQGRKYLILSSLNGTYRDQAARLMAPARVDFAQGLATERLLLALGGGRVSVAGRVSPTLAVEASVQDISLASLAPLVPGWELEGSVSGTLALSGTLRSPRGSLAIQGRGFRSSAVPIGIAPARFDARANFLDQKASIEGEIASGKSARATVSGTVSLQPGYALDLRVAGTTDLALFNAILSAEGRKLAGQVVLDGSVRGSMSEPRVAGRATLTGGDVQDIPYGFRVHDITGEAESDGQSVRLMRLAGKAGEGTVAARGTLALGRGNPVDLTLTTQNARPLVSDRFAASFDSDLNLTGSVDDGLILKGTLNLTHGEINLPDRFPPAVAVLDVRREGHVQVTAQRRFPALRLQLQLTSPGRIFVRGRGVNAEVQGQMRVLGTTTAPQFVGGFDLRRGTLMVVGQTLDLTKGSVSFDGAGIRNKIDPTLDLEATNTAGGVEMTIAVTDHASAPKIQLSSSPVLPQDEILSHILFQQGTAQLSPLQLAEIAQAAVSLTDAGAGFDPVGSVRQSLGLDRLAVGSVTTPGATESQTTVTAGKYVARNIYVGATQGVGGGSQAEVQIDVTKNLKVIGTVNNGIASATQREKQNDTSTSFGLKYQFEY